MGFRFRKRLRLFPGISLNFSKQGISSLSIGPRGATVNIPLVEAAARAPPWDCPERDSPGQRSNLRRGRFGNGSSSNAHHQRFPALRRPSRKC